MADSLRVLLVEPYFTGSHRAWAEGVVAHSRHDVRLVTHAGGFWKWRMQGAALTLGDDIAALVDGWGRPDVVLVSGMVHVAALLGFAREAIVGAGVVVYMHENQLTYPLPENATADLTYAMTNWLGLAVADAVVFNSEYHRAALFADLPRLLKSFPDHRHTGHIDAVRERSAVLPVGIDVERFARVSREGRNGAVPVVLWNHRWEYDKDPDTFFGVLSELAEARVAFEVIVAGTSYQTVPPVFADARERLGDRVRHFGTASADDYPALLAEADVVVSTAHHEFFGVAIAEAIAAGAAPLLPDRLSYRELVPGADPFLYRDRAELVARLEEMLTTPDVREQAAAAAVAYVQQFDWAEVAPRYDALFESVAAGIRQGRGGRASP